MRLPFLLVSHPFSTSELDELLAKGLGLPRCNVLHINVWKLYYHAACLIFNIPHHIRYFDPQAKH